MQSESDPVLDGVVLVPPPPGTNLAPRAFTSPAIFAHEQRAIFARSWIHVADLRDVPAHGSYIAAKIGRTPIVVLRDRGGTLRGFLNACRHRGAQLLEGAGTCARQITCPYHAWSYGLDGSLIGVPFREELAHANLDDLNLVPIRVGAVGPLIFACVDPTAPSLADWVGELPIALGRLPAELELGWELEYDIAANWKLFVENANEGYHIPVVHDILTDILVANTGDTTFEPHGAYTIADVNPSYVPPGFDPALAKIRFGCIFPNLIPVLSPSDLTYIRVDPVAHDRLRLVVRSYHLPEFAELKEIRKLTFEHTTKQDIAVVLRTQAGLHAEGLPAVVHCATLEGRIGHFERTWVTEMAAGMAPPKRALLAVR